MKSFLLPLVAVTVLSPYLDSWAGEREELPAAIGIFSKGIEIQTDRREEAFKGENLVKWPNIECIVPLATFENDNWKWVGEFCFLAADVPEEIRRLKGRAFYTLEEDPRRMVTTTPVTVYHLVDARVAALKNGDIERQRLPEGRERVVIGPVKAAWDIPATTCEEASIVIARMDADQEAEGLRAEIDRRIMDVERQMAESRHSDTRKGFFVPKRRRPTVVKEARAYSLETGETLLFVAAEKPYFQEYETEIVAEHRPAGLLYGIFVRTKDEKWHLAWHSVTPYLLEGSPFRKYELLSITDVNQDRSPELMLGFHTYEGIGWTVLRFDNKMLIPIGELWESL